MIDAVNKIEFEGDVESEFSLDIFTGLINEYNIYKKVDSEIYAQTYDARMDFLKDLMREDPTIEIPMIIDEIKYRKAMFITFLSYIEHRDFSKEFENITDNEIMSNKIEKEIVLTFSKFESKLDNNGKRTGSTQNFVKKFPEGTKLTRVMNYVADIIVENDELKNRVVGNFVSQSFHKKEKEVILSAHPLSMLFAGVIGESCLSPDGENSHGAIGLVGYKDLLVAHLPDWSWRAYVWIEPTKKAFIIFNGYPRENEVAQIVLHEYLENRGYKNAEQMSSYFPYYFDASRRKLYTENKINLFDENQKGLKPTFAVNYPRTLFGQERSSDGVINVYSCDSCDNVYFDDFELDEYGLCDACADDLRNCSVCGGAHFQDNMYWSERIDDYICESCIEPNENHIEKFKDFEKDFKEKLKTIIIEKDLNREISYKGENIKLTSLIESKSTENIIGMLLKLYHIGSTYYYVNSFFNYKLSNKELEVIADFLSNYIYESGLEEIFESD